jgi:nucleoside-diphosphate-sugar epimerase
VIGGFGYVGSKFCQKLSEMNYDFEICDLGLRGQPKDVKDSRFTGDAAQLQISDVREFSHVINLGGHSSVQAAKSDPFGAIKNNLLLHQHLVQITNECSIPYIYASSGSVYNGTKHYPAKEKDRCAPSLNMYDFTKVCADEVSLMQSSNWVALRFGTVAGPSPNMREELVVNRMTIDGMRTKKLYLANPSAHRAILSIQDLCQILIYILKTPDFPIGIYNLASVNTNMSEIAKKVSLATKSTIQLLPASETYDFSICTEKIEKAIPDLKWSSLDNIILSIIESLQI